MRPRTFKVNYETNKFEMDGREFQYVSGSFHYFRTVPAVWKERLETMRAAGLNVIDTYVEWSYHNPEENGYKFLQQHEKGSLLEFLSIAQHLGFYVILRPGPYICAERDNGGIPYWLFTNYPNIKLRTSDPNFLKEIRNWYSMLWENIYYTKTFGKNLTGFLYGNGGPIIMVQIENEYGVSMKCDRHYLNWLREETEKYVGDKAVLFTTDIPNSVAEMRGGKIDGVFATTDFGIDRANRMDAIWKMLREVQPNGPLVNSEFYPGWLTHWQEKNQRRDAKLVADTLKKMLECGASVNIYMFFGGTNFGFTAGANDWGTGKYMADITSYDYDAPMDESGDPNVEKFTLIKNVIEKHFQMAVKEMPVPKLKMDLPSVQLANLGTLLSHLGTSNGRANLIKRSVYAEKPMSFEQFGQFSGLILYEARIRTNVEINPTLLTINGLHDRAIVLLDNVVVGILSRENTINSLPINAPNPPHTLQIFVENQGRINFNVSEDFKGILGSVTLQRLDGTHEEILGWTMFGYPLESLTNFISVQTSTSNGKAMDVKQISSQSVLLSEGPAVFHGTFDISFAVLYDTYVYPVGWGKGVIYINGFNLGRYWPLVGPQVTLYVPKSILQQGQNTITLVEFQQSAPNQTIEFINKPILDKN